MKPLEIAQTKTPSVACSGKEVPLDHPKVYLQVNPKDGYVDCPYCSRRFQMAAGELDTSETT